MKVPYVSIKNAVQDWVQDNDFGHDEINETLLIKWAVDCVHWCKTPQQLKHRIVVLQVKNSRAELPDDFELLAQAAASVVENPCDCSEDPEDDCCKQKSIPKNGRVPKTRREDIVQWVQGTLEKDCDLEINLICPTCKTASCSCNTPAIEVDVDRIWEMAHPEIYYSHFTRIGRFGYGPGQNGAYSYYTPKFRLMRYATEDYFKLEHLITECPNVLCKECRHQFVIELPYIEVDFEEGEILLSYLGKPLDEDGEIMIPDHPDVHEAIVNHLDFKWYRMMFKKTKDPGDRVISQEAMLLRDQHIGFARSALDIPTFHEFKSYLENSAWNKRLPGWSTDRAGKNVIDQARYYGDMLDGKIRY